MNVKPRLQKSKFTCAIMDKYLATLSSEIKNLHNKGYSVVYESNDSTPKEDILVAALVVGIFQSRAIDHMAKESIELTMEGNPRKKSKRKKKGRAKS